MYNTYKEASIMREGALLQKLAGGARDIKREPRHELRHDAQRQSGDARRNEIKSEYYKQRIGQTANKKTVFRTKNYDMQ